MRPLFQFALAPALLLSGVCSFAQAHSPQVTLHRAERPEDLSWLWGFASPLPGTDENLLASDPRFQPLLGKYLTAPQSFWGQGRPLAEVARDFLHGPPGTVINDDNRYITADACVQHFCPDRGLLWLDLGTARPLVVFAAIDWISDNKTVDQAQATYTMWIFSNRSLRPDQAPAALRRSLVRWTSQPSSGSTALENITRVFVVDPDGTPHEASPATFGAHNTLPAETSSDGKVNQ